LAADLLSSVIQMAGGSKNISSFSAVIHRPQLELNFQLLDDL